MRVRSLDQEDPLEEEMSTHSSIFAWRSPRTEAPYCYTVEVRNRFKGLDMIDKSA